MLICFEEFKGTMDIMHICLIRHRDDFTILPPKFSSLTSRFLFLIPAGADHRRSSFQTNCRRSNRVAALSAPIKSRLASRRAWLRLASDQRRLASCLALPRPAPRRFASSLPLHTRLRLASSNRRAVRFTDRPIGSLFSASRRA